MSIDKLHMSELCTILIENKLNGRIPLKGCSDEQIEWIKNQQQVNYLPKVYVEFLKQVGCHGGYLFSRGTYSYPRLGYLKQVASDRIEVDFDTIIGKTNFVYASFDNDLVYWFDTRNEIDDPPVYTWIWKEKRIIRIYETFTTSIIEGINYEIRER